MGVVWSSLRVLWLSVSENRVREWMFGAIAGSRGYDFEQYVRKRNWGEQREGGYQGLDM